MLVLEIRNYENRTASFAAIDISSQQLLWHDLQLEETWWIGIEAVHFGHILFHGYDHLQYSNHLGITCVNATSQTIIWERKDITFKAVSGTAIEVFGKNQPFQLEFELVDIKTGEKLTQNKDEVLETKKNLLFPSLYFSTEEVFPKIAKFIELKTNEIACQVIEYLEYNSFIIISFYTKENEILQNRLILLNGDAQILMETTIDDNLKGVGNQTFMVFNNFLIYIHKKTELKLFELPI